ncbi:hypothetical protein [Petrocella sp. FN5]|uniref:hypothetical protein n=1 Tax=Petrocella sp. FN5 TaxID=3032002 RepID=UPI0023DC6B19|nr:hypothetical protein [Petrocella sp. FN5]MDF1617266.1 hypothetical protein [Petrocella sp. FN5]
MISLNKPINLSEIDERLMRELELRREMSKSVIGVNACTADAYAGTCATNKSGIINPNLCAGHARAGL